MIMADAACRNCYRIVKESDTCPICRSSSLTESWTGYVVILDPKRSKIAEKLNVEHPGKYALKVR